MIIVLVTNGKHESVDYAKIRMFESTWQADEFISSVSTGKCKYWTYAQIVEEFEQVELCEPDWES